MKKKVVIQGVPKSSKKKVVIEGLPKADVGLNMPKKKDERWDKQWEDYSKKPNSIAYPAKQILGTNQSGVDNAFYQAQPNPDNIPYNQENNLDNTVFDQINYV